MYESQRHVGGHKPWVMDEERLIVEVEKNSIIFDASHPLWCQKLRKVINEHLEECSSVVEFKEEERVAADDHWSTSQTEASLVVPRYSSGVLLLKRSWCELTSHWERSRHYADTSSVNPP